jgi:hypothetical protein
LSAAILIAAGSCIRGRLVLTVGLPLTLAGLYLASRAMWTVDDHDATGSRTPLLWGLASLAVVGFVAPESIGGRWYDLLQRAYFVGGLATIVVWSRVGAVGRRRAVLLLIGAATLIHLAGPLAVRDPVIDNWAWTQRSLQALSEGVHPYTIQTADIVHGADYVGHSAAVYPYMPMTLLAYLPAYTLFGDYRFLAAIGFPVMLALLWATGRRLGVHRELMDLASFVLLLHPRGFRLTCMGWLEPLMAVTLAAFVYLAVRRPGGLAQATALFFMPALKQYFLAPVVLFVLMTKQTSAAVLLNAVLITTVGLVPFFIWAWRPTWAGIVTEMADSEGPRLDSTSLVALMASVADTYPGRWLSAVMQFAVGALAYTRLRHAGLGGLLLASGLALLATFVTAWQAFVNYFYLVSVTLVVASILLAWRGPAQAHEQPIEF